MILSQKIKILSKLGEIMRSIGDDKEWPGFEIGINEEEYNELVGLVNQVHIYNGWFTPKAVKESFSGVGDWLEESKLKAWVESYTLQDGKAKNIALIMAGNIPLVGFHDFLAVFLSGNKTIAKLSSDDKHLFPALIKTIALFDSDILDWIEVKEDRLSDFDAVIATGSDNSANYFQSYFGKYPHIIRKNRTSIAVLNGDETKDELIELGKDVFTYFGLGCRNVSQIWLPQDFDLDRLFDAFFQYNGVMNHNKYANNYDYNKAVYLMNLESLLDNGFLLLKEDPKLNSPLGMLHFKRYITKDEVKSFIKSNHEKIQVVVGKDFIPFGYAQKPNLVDYADGVDTMKFLVTL